MLSIRLTGFHRKIELNLCNFKKGCICLLHFKLPCVELLITPFVISQYQLHLSQTENCCGRLSYECFDLLVDKRLVDESVYSLHMCLVCR